MTVILVFTIILFLFLSGLGLAFGTLNKVGSLLWLFSLFLIVAYGISSFIT